MFEFQDSLSIAFVFLVIAMGFIVAITLGKHVLYSKINKITIVFFLFSTNVLLVLIGKGIQ